MPIGRAERIAEYKAAILVQPQLPIRPRRVTPTQNESPSSREIRSMIRFTLKALQLLHRQKRHATA